MQIRENEDQWLMLEKCKLLAELKYLGDVDQII